MSTKVKVNSTVTTRTLEIDKWDGEKVSVRTHSDSVGNIVVNVATADLLDAIRTELDVIIIDKADLPEVTTGRDGGGDFLRAAGVTLATTNDPAHLREDALTYLALAEYLDSNPPVDEAQVEALAEIIFEVHPSPALGEEIARRLVERGVRVEVAS